MSLFSIQCSVSGNNYFNIRSIGFMEPSRAIKTVEAIEANKTIKTIEALESIVVKIFSDYPSLLKSRGFFEITTDFKTITVYTENQKKSLDDKQYLEPIRKIVQFYQHFGIANKNEMTEEDKALREYKIDEVVKAVNASQVPGVNGQVFSSRISEGTLSLARNILVSLSPLLNKGSVITHAGYAVGGIWSVLSLREIYQGIKAYKHSTQIQDEEGVQGARNSIASGTLCASATAAFLVSHSTKIASLAASAMYVSSALFGVGSILSMAMSATGAFRCYDFNKELEIYLNYSQDPIVNLQATLRFLKASISYTEEERQEILSDIEKNHSDLSVGEQTQLFEQKVTDLLEVKVKHMKRRTSNKSVYLISTQADTLLKELSNSSTQKQAQEKAIDLIHTIQKDNKTKTQLYALGMIASAITATAIFIASVALSGGAIVLFLLGIAGLIQLALTIYTLSGKVLPKNFPSNPQLANSEA